MKITLSFTAALFLCFTTSAAYYPNSYDSTNDAQVKILIGGQVNGSNYTTQSQIAGSNYTTRAQIAGSNYVNTTQLAGSNYTTTAQIAGSNYLNAVQVGAQIGGSNYTTSAQLAGSNYLTAVAAGSQIAGSNYTTQAQIAGSNYLTATLPAGSLTLGTNGAQFNLKDDSARLPSLPVAVFRPVSTNSAMILDLMPSGDNQFTNTTTPFFTAIDLVNRDLSSALDKTNFYVLRAGLKTNAAIIGTSAGGTNDAPMVIFQAGTNNTRPFSWNLQGAGGASNNTNMWMDSSGSIHMSNGIAGTTSADNPLAGVVGEFMAVTNNFATGTNLTTALDTNALKLTVTAGDWMVFGHATFASGTATAKGTQIKASIGLVNNTVSSDGTQVYNWPSVTNNAFTCSVSISTPVRVNVTTSTTVFLNANAIFTAGTWVVYGEMEATRIR